MVFLGDYVDRGPDSRAVLELLTHLQRSRPNTHFICGNHDFALMAFLGLLPGTWAVSRCQTCMTVCADRQASYRDTWDRDDIYVRPGEKAEWYSGPGWQGA